MPCSSCGKLLIFYHKGEIICPYCRNLAVLLKSKELKRLRIDFSKIKKKFHKKIKQIPKSVFAELVLECEKIAYNILQNISENSSLLKIWFVFNIIFSTISELKRKNITFPKKKSMGMDMVQFIKIATEYYEKRNQISLLNNDMIIFISENNNIISFRTEKCRITTIPQYFTDSFSHWKFELELFQKAYSLELTDLIKSELFSRHLKEKFNERLFPFLKPARAKEFYYILYHITENRFLLGNPTVWTGDMVYCSRISLNKFESFLNSRFTPKETRWFIDNMITYSSKHPATLDFFRFDPEVDTLKLPFNSIQILQQSVYSRIKSSKKGRDSRFKGQEFEELIHSELRRFELELFHPQTKEPLIGVELANKKYGDIDVLGYTQNKIVLIESKYWNSPRLAELEIELEKFHKRILHIEQDHPKELNFLFTQPREIIKIFYTPFAPYPVYKDIQLFPTRGMIQIYLEGLVPLRDINRLSPPRELLDFLESTENRYPFITDIHSIFREIPKNTFRIQDLLFSHFQIDDLIFSLLYRSGGPLTIICEPNNDFRIWMQNNKSTADLYFRCLLGNRQGNWHQIELIGFKPIIDQKLYYELLRNVQDTGQAQEIYNIFVAHNLKLESLVNLCIRKNESVPFALGTILGQNDLIGEKGRTLEQCECGEVMHFNPAIAFALKSLYNDRKIKCERCDPKHIQKLESITGTKLTRIGFKHSDLDFKKMQLDK